MRYFSVYPAIFLSRPNRFIAQVLIGGREETVHVKNTGRCRELLIPGCTVYIARSDRPGRKTAYDLIAVEKERKNDSPLLINMDSQAPNAAAEEWLRLHMPHTLLRREAVHGRSRFDFYLENGSRKMFIEVKGCTLEKDGTAIFPDAPTARGVKHLEELAALPAQGIDACLLIVIQMKSVRLFRPNAETDPAFCRALRHADENGVRIIAMDCLVAPDSMVLDQPVPVLLD